LILTAGRPGKQLLVRVVDEILGTHKLPLRCEPAGRAGQPFRHRVLTHPWGRPSADPAVDTSHCDRAEPHSSRELTTS
jgi:hypothetical protein